MLNALTDPWIPVSGADGSTFDLSLRDVLARGHELADLSPALYPTEREALLRLLSTVAAFALQRVDAAECDRFGDSGRFPTGALGRLDEFAERFEIRHPDRPFLQVWHYQVDPNDKALVPIDQIDPHVPGGSSAQWGLRLIPDLTAAALTRSLVVSWFHSKWSNAAAPSGMFKTVKGAPAYSGALDLTLHWIGCNLGLTIAANVLEEWVEGGMPAWLDQDVVPPASDLTTSLTGLWRSTYTPNRAVLLWADEVDLPVKFAVGCVAASRQPVPLMDGTITGPQGKLSEADKQMLGLVHEFSPQRIYYDVVSGKDAGTRKRIRSNNPNLLSTEAASRWFANGYDASMRQWGTQGRVAAPEHGDPSWRVGCYVELCDPKGGKRQRANWVTVDSALLAPPGQAVSQVAQVFTYVTAVTKTMRYRMSHATEGRGAAGASTVDRSVAALYGHLDATVLAMLDRAARTGSIDPDRICRQIADTAIRVFEDQTDALLTPATMSRVFTARSAFARTIRHGIPKEEE